MPPTGIFEGKLQQLGLGLGLRLELGLELGLGLELKTCHLFQTGLTLTLTRKYRTVPWLCNVPERNGSKVSVLFSIREKLKRITVMLEYYSKTSRS